MFKFPKQKNFIVVKTMLGVLLVVGTVVVLKTQIHFEKKVAITDTPAPVVATQPVQQSPLMLRGPQALSEVLGDSTTTQQTQLTIPSEQTQLSLPDLTPLVDQLVSDYLANHPVSPVANNNSITQNTPAQTTASISNTPIITYVQAPASQNFNSGSVFGATQLSGQSFSAQTASLGQTTINNLTVNGNTALGTTTVSSLTVNGVSITGNGGGSSGGSGNGTVATGTAGSFAYYAASDATVTSQSNLFLQGNNIGIGTNNPQATLFVEGTSTLISNNLITNGTFNGGTTGWILGSDTAYGSNSVVSNYQGGDPTIKQTTISTVAGNYYKVTFNISSANAVMTFYFQHNSVFPPSFYNGTISYIFQATYTGTDTITFDDWNYIVGDTWTLSNISLQQVSGAPVPALQVTDHDGVALLSLGADQDQNIALGNFSLSSRTIGQENTALGYATLLADTRGSSNVAIGAQALMSNVTSGNSVAIGSQALMTTTNGFNTAVGSNALQFNTTGSQNVAFGAYTLNANTTGFWNTAIGDESLTRNTTGFGNTILGQFVMRNNTSGSFNTAVGRLALSSNTTGSNNIAIGVSAASNMDTGSSTIAIGQSALSFHNSSNSVAIGSFAGRNETADNSFYINNVDEGSLLNDHNYSLLYGKFSGSAGSLTGQQLTVNGELAVNTTTPISTFAIQGLSGNDIVDIASSSGSSVFHISQQGFVGIGSSTPAHLISLSGGAYSDGASWANASDVNLKENFASITPADILQKIDDLAISEWNYKAEDASTTHIGPTAQDFYSAFHLGGANGNTSISTIDEPAVALVGIQALDQKITALQGGLLGNASTSNLVVYSPTNFSADSVGQARIETGATSVTVTFNQPYQYQPIVTADILGAFTDHNISNVTTNGFTINIPQATSTDITFNWHSFASANEQVTVSDGIKSNITLVITNNTSPVVNVAPDTSSTSDSSSTTTPDSTSTPQVLGDSTTTDQTTINNTDSTGTQSTDQNSTTTTQ